MFGRKPGVVKPKEPVDSPDVEAQKKQPKGKEPTIDPAIFNVLDRLENVGAQLLVRLGDRELYTTVVVGLGHSGFFIDTLTPPSGDAQMQEGVVVEFEALLGGITYLFTSRVVSKVRFLDELPAFKLEYPANIEESRRRKSPRILTEATAAISFTKPFQCKAAVRDISVGGMAFEYDAELGRLPTGTLLGGVLLEIKGQAVIEVYPEVVGNLVVELGGLSLPSRYRTSVSFTRIGERNLKVIESYIEGLRNR